MSEDEIESLTLAFKLYDRDGSGEIDRYEMKAALISMGQASITDEDIDELMTAVDEDKSGGISVSLIRPTGELASRHNEISMVVTLPCYTSAFISSWSS